MTTKVAFVRDSYDGEVVAVFPEEPYSFTGSDVVMYVHRGQHTSGSLEWAKEQEEPSLEEVYTLLNELVNVVGYENLELVIL